MANCKLSDDPVWAKLKAYFQQNGKKLNMGEMFANDSQRFSKLR